ncbi:nucleoside deaminase [Candidatus Babeliales bacterium]|nr:nucleoside deaminase [Candidatus Babeliales bacterium]
MQIPQKVRERFMQEALKQAHKAFDKDEVPVGAVVVDKHGTLIARAHNQVESTDTQTAHAELLALRKAGEKNGDWRLDGFWLYVTLEPCAMCLHAIALSRLAGVIYGADSPVFGFHLDKLGTLSIYRDRTLPFEIIGGVKAHEAGELLREFFRKKRVGSERGKKFSRGASGSGED